MDGIINVLKPSGMTSHDVVNFVRKCTHIKRVGHTGTLDPGAVGVLPICVGKATKVADLLSGSNKTYRAEIKLGITTDTYDSYGEIIGEKMVDITREIITETINSFKGKSEQLPPMYSAVKVGGRKLYELARKGIEVERKTRTIHIYDINIINISLENNTVLMDVMCSKGTYIRTLCYDIGQKLGCGAHMSYLLRTRSGIFTIEQALTTEQVKYYCEQGRIEEILLPIDTVLLDYPSLNLDAEGEKRVIHGLPIEINSVKKLPDLKQGAVYRVYNENGKLLCLSKALHRVDGTPYFKMVKSFY